MVSRNSFKFVMLPPQTDTTRAWARRLAEAVPEVRVVLAEDADAAAREIADAEAAFGWLGKELLSKATNLRWLQAPQAAPAAGYYYPELVSHPVSVTNFREIYNDHIGAHILAFVLAFARGLHVFIPQQLRREWKKSPAGDGRCRAFARSDGPGRWRRRHRCRGRAPARGFRCDRAGNRCTPHGGAQRGGRAASAGRTGRACCHVRIS